MHVKHRELADREAIDPDTLPGAGAVLRAGGASGTLGGTEPLLPPDVVDLVVAAIDDPFERARVAVAVRSVHVLRLLAKQQPKLLTWTPNTLCTASSEGAVELLAFLRRRQEALRRPCPVEAGWQQDWYPMDAASRGGAGRRPELVEGERAQAQVVQPYDECSQQERPRCRPSVVEGKWP
jgi:hypothetical protein